MLDQALGGLNPKNDTGGRQGVELVQRALKLGGGCIAIDVAEQDQIRATELIAYCPALEELNTVPKKLNA